MKPGMASSTASIKPVYGMSKTCQRTRAQRSVPSALQLLHAATCDTVQLLVAAQAQVLQPMIAD